MDWLNNANTIASLVMAMIGIIGSLYGIVTYLGKKASRVPQNTADVIQQASAPLPSVVPLPPFTWMDWIELSGLGLVDTVDFILTLFLRDIDDITEEPILTRLGWGFLFYGMGLGIGELILGFIISGLLSALGIQNPSGAWVIAFILMFSLLSLIYVYHIGRRVEQRREKQHQSARLKIHTEAQKTVQR